MVGFELSCLGYSCPQGSSEVPAEGLSTEEMHTVAKAGLQAPSPSGQDFKSSEFFPCVYSAQAFLGASVGIGWGGVTAGRVCNASAIPPGIQSLAHLWTPLLRL